MLDIAIILQFVYFALSKADAPALPKTRAFVHGLWYDGKEFKPQTFYVVDGILRRHRPASVDETIDLHGQRVVPPLGDAHCHHFDNPFLDKTLVPSYLKDGIFYAQSMCNSPRARDAVSELVNRRDSMDVTYANTALTSTLGHPYEVYEMLANPTRETLTYPQMQERIRNSRKAEGQAYSFVETPALLDAAWPKLLATRPDLVKIFLLDSARYDEKRAAARPGDNGLPPSIVPEIVRRAHRAKLRVYAHVETAFDFHVCVVSGVDGLAHLPGYAMGKGKADDYRLNEDDVKAFAKRGGIVQPTAWLAPGYADNDAEALKRVQAVQRDNLRLLKKYGVRIVIGSDKYGQDCWGEADYLKSLGVYSDAELLKIWTETTPQSIFPHRKIGRLTDGYEASFLVLNGGDPRENLDALRAIGLRVKQGEILAD